MQIFFKSFCSPLSIFPGKIMGKNKELQKLNIWIEKKNDLKLI